MAIRGGPWKTHFIEAQALVFRATQIGNIGTGHHFSDVPGGGSVWLDESSTSRREES